MQSKIGVVGLGYVGLPLLMLAAENDMDAYGFDIDSEKIGELSAGRCPLEAGSLKQSVEENIGDVTVSDSPEVLEGLDFYIITVPTPVSGQEPDYSYVESAAETISRFVSPGATVILESTVGPGVTRERVKPILEESGHTVGEDIFLAFCSERLSPGDDGYELTDIPRVLASHSDRGREKAKRFYSDILDEKVFEASSLEVAESSKLLENIFRDVNIALMNQVAKAFDEEDIAVNEAIEAASTKPYAFIPHWPGCGVGGHCIPVDPYFMLEKFSDSNVSLSIISEARRVNDSMPAFTVNKLMRELNELSMALNGTEVALLGISYKGGVNDLKNSPSFDIQEELEDLGAEVTRFDPYVPELSDVDELSELLDVDCILIANDCEEFRELEEMDLDGIKLVFDARDVLAEEAIGTRYSTI